MRIRNLSGFQQPFVGFFVGKIALPDKCSASAISNLNPICRVCQVFLGERASQRNEGAKSFHLDLA